ncbi:DUF6328 family protein [Diaminobutyricimonas sp. LJ205]|uniref:DUF6328 family protein n=1 Tax=Diaminobutyricimonas sp. LJ205 TaxID=2683590 RepID=UPI0012F5095A|nr:DUF6328 family protein [Diaminobutyricimonas sp. LJ205]
MPTDEAMREPQPDNEETLRERLDRNWNEILQELRVTQTGTQILTGFLLAVAFQPRFTELDDFQRIVYLILVLTAALATVLALAPVSLHRALFRQGAKQRIVDTANRILKITLVLVAITLSGTVLLIFDFVLDRIIGLIAGSMTLLIIAITWLVVPYRLGRSLD